MRKSNIELYKIIALILITIGHCITSTYYPLDNSNTDIFMVGLSALRYLGTLGNDIFIICTAYFLIDSDSKPNKKKIVNIVIDTFVISIIWLVPMFLLGFKLGKKEMIGEFFPLTFNNNWFITCYILLYLLYPLLNLVAKTIRQKNLFRLIVNFAKKLH